MLRLAKADPISWDINEVCLQLGSLYLGHAQPGTHRVARLQPRASGIPLSQPLPPGGFVRGSCEELSTADGEPQSLLSPHMRKIGWGPADFYDEAH